MSLTQSERSNLDHNVEVIKSLAHKTVHAFAARPYTIDHVDIANLNGVDKFEDDDRFIALNVSVYLENYDISVMEPVRPDGNNIPIYNDETFISSIANLMKNNGVKLFKPPATSMLDDCVVYSEKGMQGTNYLNLDVLVAID